MAIICKKEVVMFRVFTLCFLFAVLQAKAYHKTLDLQKALDMKLVQVKITALGGYMGFCINMELKNVSKDSLFVMIEAGRRLNSLEDKYQDILIVQEQNIPLKNNETKTVKVKGYCCQATNSAPSAGTKYAANKIADTKLHLLARYLNTNHFEPQAEQQAVWAISNNYQTAGITSNNDSLVLPLRQFVATVKDEPLPWYTIVSSTHVYPSGNISVTPLFLKGNMEYSNNAGNYATLTVKNDKGIPVCLTKTQWLNACSKENYQLNLPLKGLAKGRYYIELTTPEKQLAYREFEI